MTKIVVHNHLPKRTQDAVTVRIPITYSDGRKPTEVICTVEDLGRNWGVSFRDKFYNVAKSWAETPTDAAYTAYQGGAVSGQSGKRF